VNKVRSKVIDLWSKRSEIAASKWWRVIGIVLILSSLGLMGRAIALNLAQFKAVQFKFNLISLLIGILLAWFAVWIGAFAWGEIIRVLRPEVPYRDAINYHLVSIVAKYLPGLGWQQASKVFQLYRGGVPGSLTWQSVVLELVLVILVGLTIAFQFLWKKEKAIFGVSTVPGFQLGLAILLCICCAVAPIVILMFARKRSSEQIIAREFLLHLWLAELLDIAGWLSNGLALWFSINGVTHLSIDALPYCIIALIISFIGGIVIVFVPNGFGIREVIMFTILQSVLPIPLSITVALIFRITSVLADLLGVFPALIKKIWQKWILKADQSPHR
jgi:glycosyltransferase 2 family protein